MTLTNALTYALTGAGADNAKFKIDRKTGQITTRWDLDREGTAEATATMAGDCAGTDGTECTVTVTATDSAGRASSPATVNIKLTNVDEKPKFATDTDADPPIASPEAITSLENDTVLYGPVADGYSIDNEEGVTYAATDPDRLNVNLSLMGPDADKFSLSGAGVLSFRTKPNYEMPADADRDNVYEVTVRASDGTLYTDRMVMVTVADENEAPIIMTDDIAVSGQASVGYAENGTDAVGTYTARGANADMARWSLSGDDAGDFRLSSSSGMSTMLMFRTSPDFEMAADGDENNVYMVTVKAMEGDNMDTHDVTVTVTDVDELGMLTGPVSPSHMENDEDAVGTYMITGGTMSDTATWMLGGEDANHFMLDDMDDMDMERMLKFRSDPDYEMPRGMAMSDDNTNEYMVTVKAEAGGEMAMIEVTVTVTNEEETGMVTLMPMQPVVDMEVTATLTDPDIPMADSITWMWSKSMTTDGTYMAIPEATMGTYTPVAADEDYYLKATAMYTDGYGADMAEGMTSGPVTMTADQMGTVTLSSMAPVVGAALTATLTDPDGSVTGEAWQWSRSMMMDGTFMPIDGATMMAYTPMEGDVGYYLRVTVMYTDGHGSGKSAMETTDEMVMVLSSDYTLSALDLWLYPMTDPMTEIGDLTETFMADTMSYMVDAENSVEQIKVNAVTNHDGATAAVTAMMGTDEVMVSSDNVLSLAVGDTVITTTVTAQDGTTMMTYMITVTRAAPDDPLLDKFDTDNDGMFDRDEVIAAINRYLDTQDTGVSRDELIAVINRYLGS